MISPESISILKDNAIWVDPSESILWIGKPDKRSYILNAFWASAKGLASLIGAFGLVILLSTAYKKEILWTETGIFMAIVLAIMTYRLIKSLLLRGSTVYLITDARVVTYRRFFNSEIISLKLAEIVSKEIRRTFIDKKRQTGTLVFYLGETKETNDGVEKIYYSIESIEKFSEVLAVINNVRLAS